MELRNARLANCIDLQKQTKQARWNVKGSNFIALHELVDKINGAVEDYVDDIAERAVQLGGVAEGTARMVAKRRSLPEYAASAADGRIHVEALSNALAAFGKAARRVIDQANELDDLDTADLFTEVSGGWANGCGSSSRTSRQPDDHKVAIPPVPGAAACSTCGPGRQVSAGGSDEPARTPGAPSKTLRQTGHAIEGSPEFSASRRVSWSPNHFVRHRHKR